MAEKMKGITVCGDCGYYNWKKHRCSRGCTVEGAAQDHFYSDCPLPDVVERKPGAWLFDRGARTCSVCGQMRATEKRDNFCPSCGADMRENNNRYIVPNQG